jgi:hypothetical protein
MEISEQALREIIMRAYVAGWYCTTGNDSEKRVVADDLVKKFKENPGQFEHKEY